MCRFWLQYLPIVFKHVNILIKMVIWGYTPFPDTHTHECRFQQRIESSSTPIFHNFEDDLTSAEVRLHLWKLGREAEMWRQILKDHATLWIDWPPRFSGHSEVNGERIGWFCKHVRNRTGELIFGEFSEPSINPFHVFCNSVLSIATGPPKKQSPHPLTKTPPLFVPFPLVHPRPRGLAKLCYRRGAKMMAISKRGETARKSQKFSWRNGDTVDGTNSPVDRWSINIPLFCWGFTHPFGGAGFRNHPQ